QRPGKPATLVDLDRETHGVVCVDLSDHLTVRGAVLDLDGNVLARKNLPREGATGDAAIELTATLAEQLRQAATITLLGIGIGTPGVVDDHGVVRTAQNLGWSHIALKSIVEARTGVRTVVTNDANAAA